MKSNDPVMTELWKAKDVNVRRFGSLKAYNAYLAKRARLPHAGGTIPTPKQKPTSAPRRPQSR